MKYCKACNAPIIWIKTIAGKSMPCDAEQVLYWQNPKGKSTIITPNGETIKADLNGEPNKATGIGYVPHWATCPEASKFKKGR